MTTYYNFNFPLDKKYQDNFMITLNIENNLLFNKVYYVNIKYLY